MTNTLLFEDLVKQSGLKYKYIAEKLGITRFGLRKKILNESYFKPNEINLLCGLLNINSLELKERLFFASDVQSLETKNEVFYVK